MIKSRRGRGTWFSVCDLEAIPDKFTVRDVLNTIDKRTYEGYSNVRRAIRQWCFRNLTCVGKRDAGAGKMPANVYLKDELMEKLGGGHG